MRTTIQQLTVRKPLVGNTCRAVVNAPQGRLVKCGQPAVTIRVIERRFATEAVYYCREHTPEPQ